MSSFISFAFKEVHSGPGNLSKSNRNKFLNVHDLYFLYYYLLKEKMEFNLLVTFGGIQYKGYNFMGTKMPYLQGKISFFFLKKE